MARAFPGLCLAVVLGAAACGPAPGDRPEDVVVYAAASLTDVLADVSAHVQATEGLRVTHSFAGSATLARQILRGAPADVFLSASPDWVDAVERGGRLHPGTRRDLLGNELVLVAARDARPPARIEDLPEALGEDRLALADPEAVPAGAYARQALAGLGLWEELADRLAVAGDVRAAVTLVDRGECPLGVVYRTDAVAAGLPVVHAFPEHATGPIVYTAAVVDGRLRTEVSAYLAALLSPGARAVFEAHGFRPLVVDLAAPEVSR